MTTQKLIAELKKIVGDNFSLTTKDLQTHAKDYSFHQPHVPAVVIWPTSAIQISKILKLANKHALPVTARGGGSGLEANAIPVFGGIVLNMTRMNKLLKVMPDDLQVKVQTGIIGEELDKQLKKYNLWFAAAPGSKHLATIGGMIANNAGGMNAVKYGVVADAVLELQVVLADGKIVRLGSRSFKSSSGYNLKRLFIGSEGTLGIITAAVLKLTPLPETKQAILVSFSSNKICAKLNLELLRSNIQPAAIEFMDSFYIALVNQAKKINLDRNPTLLIELHGNREVVTLQMKQIKKLCQKYKALSAQIFSTPSELTTLWGYRRAVRPVLGEILPEMGVLSAEVGMPISLIPDFLTKVDQVAKKFALQTVMFGHLGDGNFHGWALYELHNQQAWTKAVALNEELIKFVLKFGGTTSGEHGIGIGKRKFMPLEHPDSLPLMKTLKKLFDPKGILNPGKIFPNTNQVLKQT